MRRYPVAKQVPGLSAWPGYQIRETYLARSLRYVLNHISGKQLYRALHAAIARTADYSLLVDIE